MADEASPSETLDTTASEGEQAAPASAQQKEHHEDVGETPSDSAALDTPAVVPTNNTNADDQQDQNVPSSMRNLVDQVEDESDDDDDDDDDSEEDAQENPMAALPPYVLQRVERLKELNAKREEIMEQYLIDRAALEAKYHGLCEPLFAERASVVQGEKDDDLGGSASAKDKKEQADDIVKDDDEKEEDADSEGKDVSAEREPESNCENKVVGIPQFWVCAMSHMEPLAELITEEDVDCLENLRDIRCKDDKDGTGFTLEFHFAPNDYFYNAVLTKRYEVPNLLLDDEPILKNVEGCKIQWKSGQSLTYRQVTKKQRGTGRNSGMVRTVKKKERRESFFHFFEPPKMPSMEDMDEEEAERLEEAFEEDYDVAQAFRSHIIPKAVLWFTGQALEEEMEQMLNDTTGVQGGDPNPFPQPAAGERPPECEQS